MLVVRYCHYIAELTARKFGPPGWMHGTASIWLSESGGWIRLLVLDRRGNPSPHSEHVLT